MTWGRTGSPIRNERPGARTAAGCGATPCAGPTAKDVSRMGRVAALSAVVLCSSASLAADAATPSPSPGDPIRVLIVGGQNNHRWQLSTPYLHYLLNRQPHIEATIGNAPGKGAPGEEWADWRPQFGRYHCVVLDYNGEMWPEDRRAEFFTYVRGGGGAIVEATQAGRTVSELAQEFGVSKKTIKRVLQVNGAAAGVGDDDAA